MSRYLLDTAPLAAFLLGRPHAVAKIDPWLERHEAATSILVYGEAVEYLMARSSVATRHAQLRFLLTEVYPHQLTLPILDRYATIRRALRPPGGPGTIGDIDTLIAATAIERGLTVVTTDGDYLRVPGLDLMLLDQSSLAVVTHRVERPRS